MAADIITITIDDRELQQALDGAIATLGDLSGAMKAVGEHLLRSTEENFAGEHDPEGRKWQPLKVLSYHLAWTVGRGKKTHTKAGQLTRDFARYAAGRKILADTHELRGSIFYKAGKRGLVWGSNKKYAAVQQLGGMAGRGQKTRIPARPYLGIGADDRTEITAILKAHLAAGMA